jgi:DNA repair protein RecN (Recombination protein N)
VHDEALRGLDERLHEVGTLVSDLAADLTGYLDDIELDPERLGYVQQRRATLAGLTRKYGETVDEVLEWSGRAAARLDELVRADDRVTALEAEVTVLRDDLVGASVRLSELRGQAATDFGSRVSEELSHLAMGNAVVEVEVRHRLDPDGVELPSGERVRLSRLGIDEVEILLAANRGAPPRTVAKAASGGELSRVMLALEVVGADRGARTGANGSPERTSPPTFVFDEVDAGVGGRAALDVGARLAALAEHSQVIVVTHLAQVAAFADRHLVVHKADDGRVTSSSVTVVQGDERLRELSRMMGGDPDSGAGLAHASDLVDQTAAVRATRATSRPATSRPATSRAATTARRTPQTSVQSPPSTQPAQSAGGVKRPARQTAP